MATCTVQDVMEDAADYLGDPEGEVYNAGKLARAFGKAFRGLYDCMILHNLPPVHRTVTYTLPANTASSTFGLTDMGEPDALWERGVGETLYAFIAPSDPLPQWESSDRLRVWKRENETFYFIAATQDRELKIEYWSSGAAPAAGTITTDNARDVLAMWTAYIAAQSNDMPSRARELSLDLFGHSGQPDGTGGALRGLIGPMILEEQNRASRAEPFRYRRNADRALIG
jgi:hypothetical protein